MAFYFGFLRYFICVICGLFSNEPDLPLHVGITSFNVASLELHDELGALSEKCDNAQKNFHELTDKNQEQVSVRLTDAVFARMIVYVRSLQDAMPSELRADIDCGFLTAIAEQPNEILKCAMYLFLGYLDGASQFAQSCGGRGASSDLLWGRNPDEDDRSFAYRCMMQAHRMMRSSQHKRSGTLKN